MVKYYYNIASYYADGDRKLPSRRFHISSPPKRVRSFFFFPLFFFFLVPPSPHHYSLPRASRARVLLIVFNEINCPTVKRVRKRAQKRRCRTGADLTRVRLAYVCLNGAVGTERKPSGRCVRNVRTGNS